MKKALTIRLRSSAEIAAELAIRTMSEKARGVYGANFLLTVYKVGEQFFCRGCIEKDDLTFKALEKELEALAA